MRKLLSLFFMFFPFCAMGMNINLSSLSTADLYQYLELVNKDYESLRQSYEESKTKENSLANRILGAAAIGLGGVGGMQLASALSEQAADADAEMDMRTYLASFKCSYGDNASVSGGTENVETPGAGMLFSYVAEYKKLATELRAKKEALGLSYGIESEHLSSTADAGLYDTVTSGRSAGVFVSVSRALSDATGTDVAGWQAQKDATNNQVLSGAVIGGVGVVGGAVGNLLINKDVVKK